MTTPRIALALSGGGFRAALFHLGVLRRVAELGWLRHVTAISGVSGGSILAAFAALRWQKLLAADGEVEAFDTHIVQPFVRAVADHNLIAEWGIRLPGVALRKAVDPSYTRTDALASILGRRLYEDRLCSDLPAYPCVVLNATSLISVRAWRFTREGLGDSRIGYSGWNGHTSSIGDAVAASAAFPPVFAPARIVTRRYAFDPPAYEGEAMVLPRTIPLTDGGVYENSATEVLIKPTPLPGGKVLEPADFLLVSDGGYPAEYRFTPPRVPGLATFSLLRRANDIAMEQVSALRRRMLVDAFKEKGQPGLLVVLGSSIDRLPAKLARDYRVCVGDDCCLPKAIVEQVHRVRTHLNRFSEAECETVMYHGYMLTDALLWSRHEALPTAYRRPAGPPGWRVAFTPERSAATGAALARSHRLW